jgi:hypothetical protein
VTKSICWVSLVTRAPYFHESGDAEINLFNHFSVGLYRTASSIALFVSPNVSANPNIHVDNNDKHAFLFTRPRNFTKSNWFEWAAATTTWTHKINNTGGHKYDSNQVF